LSGIIKPFRRGVTRGGGGAMMILNLNTPLPVARSQKNFQKDTL
jgi:hypothetical protein